MKRKKLFSILMIPLIAAGLFLSAPAKQASAQVACGEPYVIEANTDLTEVAEECEVPVRLLRRLNPQVEEADTVESGTMLDIPLNGIYVVRPGDTISEIAVRYNTTINRLLARNPGIEDPHLIYARQTLDVPVLANTVSDDIHIVERGDTLFEIAAMYNVPLDSLLDANPEITNPNIIYTGQVIDLPEDASETPGYLPHLSITPLQGFPGSTVTVRGYDFPSETDIEVGPGVYGSEATYLNTVTSDEMGHFTASITIPADEAEPGESWVILAMVPDRDLSALSARFIVTEPASDGDTYVVKSGDTLLEIAQMFGTTIDSLMALNPQIEHPDLIYTGWVLTVD